MRREGLALAVILGFLALLAALAASFLHLSTVERRIAHNHVDYARARWAADSGVETAIARLRTADWFESDDWTLSESPEFRARIRDEQGRLNVNDGAELGPAHPVSLNLRRMLDVLGRELGIDGLGTALLDARPPGGYAHGADLQRALGWDRARFDRVRPFVTVDAWRDPSTAILAPLSAAELDRYPVRPERPIGPDGEPLYRRGHGPNRRGEDLSRRFPLRFVPPGFDETGWRAPWAAAVWTLKSLNPQWIERAPRSPVNVNTAPREVLTALIADLEGFFLAERRRPVPFDFGYAYLGHQNLYDPAESNSTITWSRKGGEIGFLYRTWPIRVGGEEADGLDGRRIVDRIVAGRRERPFRSWEQLAEFLGGLVDDGTIRDPRAGFVDYVYVPPTSTTTWSIAAVESPNQRRIASQAIADALLANFDPNLHLNELNPDRPLRRLVDKTDLIVQSTELCFVPMGRFEIESEGWARGPAGQELAAHRVTTVVKLYDATRIGTQAEIERGERIGAESGPEVAAPGSEWEGYVRAVTRAESGGAAIEDHFRPWRPGHVPTGEPAGNFPARGETAGGPYGPPRRQVDARVPADLRLDGLYVELHGAYGVALPEPAFERSAAFAMWIKPSWSADQAGKVRSIFSLSDTRTDSQVRLQNLSAKFLPLPFGLSFLPAYQGEPDPELPIYMGEPRRASLMFSMGLDLRFSDRGGGLGVVSPSLDRPEGGPSLRPGVWTHAVVLVDVDADPGRRARMLLDGREWPNTAELAAHLTGAPAGRIGEAAGATLRIGGEYSAYGAVAGMPRFDFADATIDEFHVWFDDPEAEAKALRLFRAGRYAPSAEWSCAPIEMGTGRRKLAPPAVIAPPSPEPPAGPPPPTEPAWAVAAAWTARGSGAEEVWLWEDRAGATARRGPLAEPGWSRASEPAQRWPLAAAADPPRAWVQFLLRTQGNEPRVVDDVTIFYTTGCEVLSRVEGF
jgi:hypothetical protein